MSKTWFPTKLVILGKSLLAHGLKRKLILVEVTQFCSDGSLMQRLYIEKSDFLSYRFEQFQSN